VRSPTHALRRAQVKFGPGAGIYIEKLCGCEAWRDPAGDHAVSVPLRKACAPVCGPAPGRRYESGAVRDGRSGSVTCVKGADALARH
jgi:hypothetical protein